ncbi:nuclear transport factor 2 family protein [Mangrovimonas cancribranchiae]|uniref:Nuclear transport factor 2 family protein n=1 Tax=Mangrovimonas cancribranchiae TaxID=3080055 RepID=A0AAU6P949_9FLAO
MTLESLIKKWFACWECGDLNNLPISKKFTHSSPFGTIESKQSYLELVNNNKDKFLNYKFTIHDTIYNKNKACVRYTATQEDFELDVSEWYYVKNNYIEKIIAYYHIGDIKEERLLNS